MFAAMPRRLRLGIPVALVAILLLPGSALAETFTVDPADANNACTRGSDDTCKTIDEAVAAAQSGDAINVLKGTYAENVAIPQALSNLTLTGGPEVKVTGAAAGGDVVAISATGVQ